MQLIIVLRNAGAKYADKRYLSLRHHPIPLQPAIKIRTEDMTDLRVTPRRQTYNGHGWDVPVLLASTVTGSHRDVMVGKSETDFADFDVILNHLNAALAR